MIRNMYITLYSKSALRERNLPDIYDLTLAGDWTVGKQLELIKGMYNDKNGDSKRDDGDFYGFVSGTNTSCDPYWVGFNLPILQLNRDSGEYFIEIDSDRMVSILETIHNLITKNADTWNKGSGGGDVDGAYATNSIMKFAEGGCAMTTTMIYRIEVNLTAAGYDGEYGIAPIPKLDSNQDGYRTDDVTVHLLADGEVIDTVKLSKDNNWSYVAVGMDQMDAQGNRYTYIWTEGEHEGWAEGAQTEVQVSEDEDLTKKYKNRYVETQEDYEKAIAAWKALGDEWEGKLTAYTVDLSKAKKLLEKAGWTLNRNGEPFQEGVDDVRCKKMEDGSIVALDLKLMYPQGNHMAELMETAVRDETVPMPEDVVPDADAGSFVENLARVGIKLELVPAPMEELLKSYYRQTERTTDMIYLATNFHVIVDPSITYSTDTTKNHEIWNNTYSDDEELWIDAKAMRKTEPGDIFEYVSKWVTFQERYNEVLPTIPIYSNIYYDFYNEHLQNYYITGQVTWSQAILPAYFALENLETPAAAEEDDGDFESFD